jgi:Uma2 family endonuclease
MVELKIGPRTLDLPFMVRVPGVSEAMFDRLVDEDTKAELLDGVMIVHAPASLRHDDVSGFLRALVRSFAEDKDLGKVFGPDSLVRLARGRKFAPDIYLVTKDRVPPRRQKEFRGAPDLIVEVLSPSTRLFDLGDKRSAYRKARVPEIWFVDPDREEVVMDALGKGDYGTTSVRKGRISSQVLPGFWVEAAWLWADPMPNLLACVRQILG